MITWFLRLWGFSVSRTLALYGWVKEVWLVLIVCYSEIDFIAQKCGRLRLSSERIFRKGVGVASPRPTVASRRHAPSASFDSFCGCAKHGIDSIIQCWFPFSPAWKRHSNVRQKYECLVFDWLFCLCQRNVLHCSRDWKEQRGSRPLMYGAF